VNLAHQLQFWQSAITLPGDAKIVNLSDAGVLPSANTSNLLFASSQSLVHLKKLTAEQPKVLWHSETQTKFDLKTIHKKTYFCQGLFIGQKASLEIILILYKLSRDVKRPAWNLA